MLQYNTIWHVYNITVGAWNTQCYNITQYSMHINHV